MAILVTSFDTIALHESNSMFFTSTDFVSYLNEFLHAFKVVGTVCIIKDLSKYNLETIINANIMGFYIKGYAGFVIFMVSNKIKIFTGM